jgi:hypothetical protein
VHNVIRVALVLTLVGCHRQADDADDAADAAEGVEGSDLDLPSDQCTGHVFDDVCYELWPLYDSNGDAVVVQLGDDPELMVVGLTWELLHVARFSDAGFMLQTHAIDKLVVPNPHRITIGDFAADGVTRIVLGSGSMDLIYTFTDGVAVHASTFEYNDVSMRRVPAGALDLLDGSSLLATQGAQPGTLATYRLTDDGWAVQETVLGPATYGLRGALSCDANGDGLRDAALWAGDDETEELHVFVSDGVGGFAQHVFPHANCQSSWFAGDVTGDGHLDLACSTYYESVKVVVGSGNGTFDGPIDAYVFDEVRFLLGVANLGVDGGPALLLRGGGVAAELFIVRAPFDAASEVSLPFPVSWLYEVADFNGDGLEDLVVKMNGDTGVLLSRRF